jgi:hypothetical protein
MRLTPELLRLATTSSERILDDEDLDPERTSANEAPAPRRSLIDADPPQAIVDPSALPYVLSVEQAAALLATTSDAVYARVSRGQLTGRHGLLRTGRKVQFLRDRLLRALETMADDQIPRGGRR